MKKKLARVFLFTTSCIIFSYFFIYFVSTQPIDSETQVRFDYLVRCTQKHGFSIKKPILRKSRILTGWKGNIFSGATYPFGMVPMIPSIIEVVKPPVYEGLLAHELGHVVDAEMLRFGHPVFNKEGLRYRSIEDFADVVGQEILHTCMPFGYR